MTVMAAVVGVVVEPLLGSLLFIARVPSVAAAAAAPRDVDRLKMPGVKCRFESNRARM